MYTENTKRMKEETVMKKAIVWIITSVISVTLVTIGLLIHRKRTF